MTVQIFEVKSNDTNIMCGACVPYATGIGRFTQGINYLKNN
jgi:hypothetical protein